VRYIVPVSVPRVTYTRSVSDCLPHSHLAHCTRSDDLCPACRLFGWVHDTSNGAERTHDGDGKETTAYAGRVLFSHASLRKSAGTLPPLSLAILSSPKPTTVRFYLRPRNRSLPARWEPDQVDRGYNSDDNVLRGRKIYRHHGRARAEEFQRANGICDDQNRTIEDALSPDATFEFTVRFHNLAAVELGALLWSLEMDRRGFHRLGFGKPLGFGSVTIRVDNVRVLDPAERYGDLSLDGWHPVSDWQVRFVEPFKRALALRFQSRDFESLDNVKDLRALLGEPPSNLAIHYPRTGRMPDPKGKNFEWFMGNNRKHFAPLPPALEDQGLPLLTRDGVEI
jgi:CRISPR-associated protein (TIGR03986 family)